MRTWGIGYEKSKRKARKIYSKIGRVVCPALNGEPISFTNEGFNHLVRKGRVPRTKTEQKKRFRLVPYIESIISDPNIHVSFRHSDTKYVTNRHGKKHQVRSVADFWSLSKKVGDCVIRIVIRQLEGGDKHFFSVMGNNMTIKKSHER